ARRSPGIGVESVQALGEAATRNQLHAEVVAVVDLAYFIDRYDPRMVELSDGLSLVLEPLNPRFRRATARPAHLHGHTPVQADLPRFVDPAHRTPAQRPDQLAITQPGPRCPRRVIALRAALIVGSVDRHSVRIPRAGAFRRLFPLHRSQPGPGGILSAH